MNTVKLLICSGLGTGLFGNTDNQGHPWPPMAGFAMAVCYLPLLTGVFKIKNQIFTWNCSNGHVCVETPSGLCPAEVLSPCSSS